MIRKSLTPRQPFANREPVTPNRASDYREACYSRILCTVVLSSKESLGSGKVWKHTKQNPSWSKGKDMRKLHSKFTAKLEEPEYARDGVGDFT